VIDAILDDDRCSGKRSNGQSRNEDGAGGGEEFLEDKQADFFVSEAPRVTARLGVSGRSRNEPIALGFFCAAMSRGCLGAAVLVALQMQAKTLRQDGNCHRMTAWTAPMPMGTEPNANRGK
jgi:hypothetical protein